MNTVLHVVSYFEKVDCKLHFANHLISCRIPFGALSCIHVRSVNNKYLILFMLAYCTKKIK